MALVVTDRRVYGQAMFGKRVDLPVDLISAVGTSFLNGILVSTSSGKICFLGVENKNEIHDEISKLLMARQEKASPTIKQEISQSNAGELKKFKELLDSGVITQEEFDAKKKQLLGL
ncbi:MAG: SHOCT domain-containing protein [Clostridia bacterium]|nr:SHOCT domain-containing protein [Clostridia bacterium]